MAVAATEQRAGDPDIGFDVLLEGAYVGCGIPRKVWDLVALMGVQEQGPSVPAGDSELPYYLSEFTTRTGVEVVAPNCLSCHANTLNGELVIGLGGIDLDYSETATALTMLDDELLASVSGLAGLEPEEEDELVRFAKRFQTVFPYIQTRVAGVNPADNLAAILFAHRDPVTLEWSDEPLMEPPAPVVMPVDVPPWWRMKRKNSMFYVAGGHGDHARIMMTASTLCVDSVEEAQEIDATMPDLQAYIHSLEAPQWPYEWDPTLAEEGEAIFQVACAPCHGTHGPDGVYPNLVIPVDEVGTDNMLTDGAAQFSGRFIDWYASSFYGEVAWLEPHQGYVPPPLDGIWATAPFLHNGSVPTLETLLDSSARPTYWRRSYSSSDYDVLAMGWHHEVLETGQAEESDPALRRRIYDTTLEGYGNQGHIYGDWMNAEERLAVLEYLKSL